MASVWFVLICIFPRLAQRHGILLPLLYVANLSATNPLLSALLEMLPEGCGASVGVVSTQAEPFEYVKEGELLENASLARSNEFIEGRRCAREALAQVGYIAGALLPNADGLPEWPCGAIASISHSRGLCCAVAASVEGMPCLGLDLEKTNRLSPQAVARVLHPQEVDFVGENQALASLIFSAKEAFFKAQFPVWGVHANFSDLALRVDDASGHLFADKVALHLPEELRGAAQRMQFRYRFVGDYVVTLCWL